MLILNAIFFLGSHPSKFRKWDEIGFFDRVTYLRNVPKFYKWKADLDSLTSAGNFLRFEIRREYDEEFKILATGKDIDVKLQVTCQRIFTSQNISDAWEENINIPDENKINYQDSKFGVFNILIEEPENKRLKTRDVPGVFEDSVFRSENLEIEDPVFEFSFSEDFIFINYTSKEIEVCGFEDTHFYEKSVDYEIRFCIDDFCIKYLVDGETKLETSQGGLIYETHVDLTILQILLENDSNISQEKKNKLIKSCNESYEFLGYTESISNGCSSTGMIFEFLYEEELDFEPKYLGLCSRISDTLDIKPTKEYLEGFTYEYKKIYIENKGESNRISEPYRIFNADHFDDNYPNMSLYGSSPLIYSIETTTSTGLIMLSSCDSLVDMIRENNRAKFEWTNETGVIDLYLFNSDDYECNAKVLVELTGKPPQPLECSLGYNQCRWNYYTQEELLEVNNELINNAIPTDFLWLDIEHTNSKMYFTFDNKAFPDQSKMLENLVKSDRQLVTIVDPHYKIADPSIESEIEAKIKSLEIKDKKELDDFISESKEELERQIEDSKLTHYITTEGINQEILVLKPNGEIFVGKCWPGNSVYIDFLNKRAQVFFGNQYLKKEHLQSNPHVHIKNDMNEPSVFSNELEKTIPKNCIHTVSYYEDIYSLNTIKGLFEHREVHNLYGLCMAKSSYEGLIQRKNSFDGVEKNIRSFLLSRSYYIGSQKFCAIWIGDSTCKWDHLQKSITLCCTISLSGISFCGFDTPGFFEDPTPEFCARGYQIGCMFPFFRAHSDRKTKRREPYLFESPFKEVMIRAIETRYELLITNNDICKPIVYTAFHRHRVTNQAVVRPVFNYDEGIFVKDQIFIGDRLMGKGIVKDGIMKTEVYLPDFGGGFWYQRHKSIQYNSGETISINCEIKEDSEVPIFVKGGSIIPEFFDIRKQNIKSLWEIRKKPEAEVRLWVYPDELGSALGYLYQDDGFTFDYQQGNFNLFKFEFDNDENNPHIRITYLHRGYEGQSLKFFVMIVGQNKSIEVESLFTENKLDFEINLEK